MQNSLLTHPTGHFRVIFFCKNWDLSYHYIYLGHPLKLKGVWANIILMGDFTAATPSCSNLCSCPLKNQDQKWLDNQLEADGGIIWCKDMFANQFLRLCAKINTSSACSCQFESIDCHLHFLPPPASRLKVSLVIAKDCCRCSLLHVHLPYGLDV